LLVIVSERVQVASYEALARRAFGSAGYYITLVAMFAFAFGAMIGYLLIGGSALVEVLRLCTLDGTVAM
jgi:amino acid permease